MTEDQIKADFQQIKQKLTEAEQLAYKYEDLGGSGLEEDLLGGIQMASENLDRVEENILFNFQEQN